LSELLAPELFDEEAILDAIARWVAVESPTNHVAGVNRMMDLAAEAMGAIGASIDRRAGQAGFGDIVTARLGPSDPGILVLAHLDTVHRVGTIDDSPPHRDGDRFLGPGAYDMKGGALIAVHALRVLLGAGETTKLPVTFMFTPDEEVGSPTSRTAVEAEARHQRYVLVPEPAQNRGDLITGRWAFQRFIVEARGVPAHAGANLKDGSSAIREIAAQIPAIEAISDPDRNVTVSVGVIRGGTFVNVVASECTAEALAVTPTQADFEAILERMTALQPTQAQVDLTVRRGPVRPLFEPNRAGLDLYERARQIATQIGFAPGHGTVGGGSDGNFTGALGIPTLDGVGVCGDGFHTLDEHLLISSLVPRTRLLAELFRTLD
jgi:glutamate carboxypeptidase